MYWNESLGRIELQITKHQAKDCSHSGDCELDVKTLLQNPKIKKQIDKLDPKIISASLKEFGAWNDIELEDIEQNKIRLLWIACCDINENR